jgi:hypothetical protein
MEKGWTWWCTPVAPITVWSIKWEAHSPVWPVQKMWDFISKTTRAKKSWRHGSSVWVPSWQAQSPEFKPKHHQKIINQKFPIIWKGSTHIWFRSRHKTFSVNGTVIGLQYPYQPLHRLNFVRPLQSLLFFLLWNQHKSSPDKEVTASEDFTADGIVLSAIIQMLIEFSLLKQKNLYT